VVATEGGGHIWICPTPFSEGPLEFSTGAGASLKGFRGHDRMGSPKTQGICEEGSPGTGDSKGVSLVALWGCFIIKPAFVNSAVEVQRPCRRSQRLKSCHNCSRNSSCLNCGALHACKQLESEASAQETVTRRFQTKIECSR
jgi:hypothetical protein